MRFLCLKTDPVTSDSNYWLLGLGEAGAEGGGYPLSTDLMIKWGEDGGGQYQSRGGEYHLHFPTPATFVWTPGGDNTHQLDISKYI